MASFSKIIKGKKVLVFGLGRQGGGIGDANWLVKHGALVKATDQKSAIELGIPTGMLSDQVELTLGKHVETDVEWADLIIKNPGVPDEHPLLAVAKQLDKPVLTSIAVFVQYAPLTTIGITGTRGKSTTTALISALLEQAFPESVLTGGNIPGTSGLEMLDHLEGKKYAVLELSSFQLHNFHDLRVSPQIAVVTNLYPDHLNRYPSMDSYRQDKEAIVAYQKQDGATLVNSGNEGAMDIAKASTGKVTTYNANEVKDWPTSLPGEHNRENIAAMWALARTLGIKESLAREVVQNFHGLPFRQEKIRELGGVVFINDTTATTPTATLKAIAAQDQPTVLICGGATKNLPFTELVDSIARSPQIKKVIFLGSRQIPEFTQAVKSAAGEKVLAQVDSMSSAVREAQKAAQSGWNVLLSPGFASFDLFQNEFDRGRQFNDAVNSL